ncbi:MAG: hypothetical protein CL870_04150 [Cytophagia bacterium]|jgi:hypothetical protein|nr:hypothetical protein [Cytophagia bacterium]
MIIFSYPLLGQSEYTKFVKLKKLFIEEKFSELIKSEIDIKKNSEFYPYLLFYNSVAEYKLKSKVKALDILKKIIKDYPNWSQKNEVYYWLVKINSENNNLDEALISFSMISNSSISDGLYSLIDPLIENINSFSRLSEIYKLYPKNKSVAKYYGRSLLREYLTEDVINEINNILEIVEKEDLFVIDDKKFRVAVLLPFMFSGLADTYFIQNNDFVMDLYSGISHGIKKYDSLSSMIDIVTFDTRRDPNRIKSLIDNGSFDNVDLIIGPLYNKPISIIKQFCLEKKILMINPLSSNNEIIDDNNYSFLFKPSIKTVANKVSEFSINNFSEKKNAIIFYENNYQDSLIAEIYNNKLESQGFNIIYKKSVSLEDSRLILDSLASTYEYILSDSLFDTLKNVSDILIKEGRGIEDLDTTYMYTEKFFIENDSIGHVFVSSKNSLFASNIISAIEIREDTIPVLGFSDWLNFNVISVNQFEELDISLIDINFFDEETETYKDLNSYFQQNYKRKISENFLVGFELINMITKITSSYGKYFQFGLRNENKIKSDISTHSYYLNNNDNQKVPIVKVKNFEIKLANQF